MELSETEMDRLKQNFEAILKVPKGKLDHNQFRAALSLCGYKPSSEELLLLINRVDPEGKKKISYKDLVESAKELKRLRKEARDEKRTKALTACRKHDVSKSGVLSLTNLTLALSDLKLDKEKIHNAMQKALETAGMQINYEDFIENSLLD